MDHLGQPTIGFDSSVQPPSSSTVNCESEDQMKASKYQVLWSSIMDKGNYIRPSGYHKAAVLLLCWDEDCVDLATEEEVNTLKGVFEAEFGYSAVIFKMSTAKGELQVQVNQKVANFVGDYGGPNTLLIVYYAGHGKPGSGRFFGDLELFGQISPNDPRDSRQCQEDRLSWIPAEDLLRYSKSDILQIFDCCYAGQLGHTRGDDRYTCLYFIDFHLADNFRSFEFLAANRAMKTTRAPGKDSFTSALIYALKRLVGQKEGRFTTDELLRTIREHPHFPKNQEPILAERIDPHAKAGRIMLHPIRRDGTALPVSKEVSVIEQAKKNTVTLHFEFGEEPSEQIIEFLGLRFNDIFNHNNLELQRIRWGEMNASGFVRATRAFQSYLHKRRASKKEERPKLVENSDADFRRLTSTSDQSEILPPSPAETHHSQDSIGNTDFAGQGSADSSGGSESMPKNRQKRRRTSQHGEYAS